MWVGKGSASAGQALDLTAGKLPLDLSRRIAAVHGRQWSTHCCQWPIPRRTTGLLWNLTFNHAAEKARGGYSGRSWMATLVQQRIRAERLHPKATHWRCRSIGDDGGLLGDQPPP